MRKLFGLFAFWFLFSGCGSRTYLVQPDFNPGSVKRVGVIVPYATVKNLELGNNISINQELSSAAKQSVEQGSIAALKEHGFEAFPLTNNDDAVSFLKGYRSLIPEIESHFPGKGIPNRPSKIEGFDRIRKNSNLDCVVAVEGLDHRSTAARKAMMVLAAGVGITGGEGLTHILVSVFCGESGKPQFFDTLSWSSSINSESDVSNMVGILVDHMKAVTPAAL